MDGGVGSGMLDTDFLAIGYYQGSPEKLQTASLSDPCCYYNCCHIYGCTGALFIPVVLTQQK